MKPYSSEVQIYPIIPYFKSSSKQSSLKINGNSRSNFIRLNDENTQKSWSLYLLPDMYYREEISMDIAMRLLDKLTELSNKKRR